MNSWQFVSQVRYSKLFGHTTKNVSRDAVLTSHKLLLQAGFIKESTAGKYYFLPLGWRVHEKIRKIIKEEMDAAGAQEMLSPVLHPLELWQETNRTSTTGFELLKVKDRNGKEFALGGTAEEMFVDLVRRMNLTHKDVPFNIYQFSTKFRDELRPRGGLLRVREFIMKDAYSFDKNEEEFKKTYELMKKTYTRIFERLGLQTTIVESDNGYIGGEYCHEFVVESDAGESRFFVEESSSSTPPTSLTSPIPPQPHTLPLTYAAHEEVCKFSRQLPQLPQTPQTPQTLQEVDAPRGPTMKDGEKFHKILPHQQLKTVAYVNDKKEFILAAIRGDLLINEMKLAHQTGSILLRPATDDEIIKQLNSYPGFLSPISLLSQITPIRVIADLSVPKMVNFVTGANREHRDVINANYDRDFQAEKVCDIGKVFDGAISESGKKLVAKRGIEVGNIFQLGYHYTNLMKGAEFVNENGMMQKFYMGCYGIGLGRNLQTIAEIYHDDKGILWPECVAPYRYHLISLTSPNSPTTLKIQELASQLHEKLGANLLWDDRENVSAGAKFADADLIGCPVRIVISEKTAGKLEIKKRGEKETKLMTVEEFFYQYV